jgi:flagellar M-ring protein FliF
MSVAENRFQNQMAGVYTRLGTRQKAVIGGVTLAALAAVIALVTLVNRPSMGVLFGNLNPQDASQIVEKLKEKEIPYELEDGGKTVLVPKQQIYDVRLSLAGAGLPQSSVIGYEVFDRTNLGVSDFVQKVNYRRALEGELARTILQLDEVEGARVHIVAPQKALFKEDEKPATASVVLKLKSGLPMKRETVQGITHLVASSVEGLEPANVTVVDSRGSLLSDNTKPNSIAGKTSTQYELQQKVEAYLVQKAQSMLEGVVGPGNALVQVNAELDFRQAERTLEQYDPEKSVVRSEQTTEEKTVTRDSVPPSTRTATVTNYEINKSIEHIIDDVGAVRRLSVAVLVNSVPHTVEVKGESVTEYSPRPREEMDQLTDVVKRAVGFDLQRKDEVSVVNLPFRGPDQKEEFITDETPVGESNPLYLQIFLAVAMLGSVVILWSLLKRFRVRVGGGPPMEFDAARYAEIPAGGRPGMAPRTVGEYSGGQGGNDTQRRIADYIQTQPEEASRLLKVWMSEE